MIKCIIKRIVNVLSVKLGWCDSFRKVYGWDVYMVYY